jgi:hypothetical protein
MKISHSSGSMAVEETGRSLFQKMLFASLIIVLLFASLPAPGASAASAQDLADDLENEWENKVEKVEIEGMFYQRVRVYPADFKDPNEFALANEILNNYGSAYLSAQRLAFNHTGFDAKGQVINENQANASIKAVAENLRIMRVLRKRLNDLNGNYRLLPAGAIPATTP